MCGQPAARARIANTVCLRTLAPGTRPPILACALFCGIPGHVRAALAWRRSRGTGVQTGRGLRSPWLPSCPCPCQSRAALSYCPWRGRGAPLPPSRIWNPVQCVLPAHSLAWLPWRRALRWRRTPPAGGASDSSDGSGGVALTGAAPATPTARADGGVAAPERAWWPCDGCASCRRCWAVPEAVRAAKEAASPAREAVPGPVAGLATAVSKPDKRDARRASARRLYARSRWRAGGRDLRRGSRV